MVWPIGAKYKIVMTLKKSLFTQDYLRLYPFFACIKTQLLEKDPLCMIDAGKPAAKLGIT